MSSSKKSHKSGSKQKKSQILLVGGVSAAVVAIGAGAAFFFLSRSRAEGILAIAAVIPQEAQVVIDFNTKPEPWQKLQQFGTPESQKLLSDALQKSPLNSLLIQSKTDFKQDVQPWLGSNVVTALVANPQKPNGAAGTLIIAATNNSEQSSAFLMKYRNALTQQGARFSEKQYKEFKYFESPTKEPGRSVVTADIGGKLVAIATSSDLIQRTFDTYKRELPSLAQKPSFTDTLGKTVGDSDKNAAIAEPLTQIYLDGSIALEFIASQTPLSLNNTVVEQSRKELDAITLVGGTQKEGIRLEIATYLKAREQEKGTQDRESVSTVMGKLPQETFLAISGVNLSRSWQSLVAQAKGNPASAKYIEQLRKSFKDASQLDLDRDVMKWMTGEFAIAAIPNDRGILTNLGFGFVVLAETSDRSATDAMFAKLDNLVKSSSGGIFPQGATIKTKKLGDKEFTTWESAASTVFSHGSLSDNFVLLAMGDLPELLVPQPAKSLPESSAFQILTTALPKNNGGYFYLNMTSVLTIADKLIPTEVKTNQNYTQIRAVLDAIRGIAVTNTNLDNRTSRLDILFTLKPTPGN